MFILPGNHFAAISPPPANLGTPMEFTVFQKIRLPEKGLMFQSGKKILPETGNSYSIAGTKELEKKLTNRNKSPKKPQIKVSKSAFSKFKQTPSLIFNGYFEI